MANYTQYIPQTNTTTYPVSISNCFTALTSDVTALESDKVNLVSGTEQVLLSDIKIEGFDLTLKKDSLVLDWIRPSAGVGTEAKIRVYDDVTFKSDFGWNFSTSNWYFNNALTITSGDLTLSAGNVNVSGTVDGRDVAADGTQLDTNTGQLSTNTTKLSGIETLADVTDTTNVTAAGALMDSEVNANLKTLVLPASTTISTFGASLVDDAAASNARTTLGLGSMATQFQSVVTISGGTISGITDITVADGGTGSSTASGARTNLGLGSLATRNSVTAVYIDANSVGQSELKTTGWTYSRTGSGGANYVMSTGSRGFYPLVRQTTGAPDFMSCSIANGHLAGTTSTAIGYYTTTDSAGGGASYDYVQASPPYDLGDGIVGLFIFGVVDNTTGKLEQLTYGREAPWHYNGPTDIVGKIDKKGRKWQERKDMSDIPMTYAQARNNQADLIEYSQAFNAAPIIRQEITQTIKQADMNLIPHSFIPQDLTGKTVVMLDPVSDLNHELLAMQEEHDEFKLDDLFRAGHLQISNTGLGRSGPAGILIPSFKWKNT